MVSDKHTADFSVPGARIAHYEIQALIGQGGMGVVYRARDLNLDREVALKRPSTSFTDNPRARLRFSREARAASKLQHPNIVTIFEFLEEEGYSWIAMEFVEGDSLGRYLTSRGPLRPLEMLNHAEGLADALREAHRHRVIHRDIKPSNILIDRNGHARLADFGLAQVLQHDEVASDGTTQHMPITEVGAVVGTAAYMSPEQALGKDLDERTDIFSLGAVLYEMCTARPAFAKESKPRTLDAILHREPRAIPPVNPEVSEEIVRIIGKCLSKLPDERYQSAKELHADLRVERRRIQSTNYAASHPSGVAETEKNNTSLLVTLLLVAVLLSGVALYFWLQAKESSIPAFHPRPITALAGWESEVAISPDGQLLAYVSDESGNADIWLVDIRGGDALRLTNSPALDRSPNWYPDGSAIAFYSERGPTPGIWKVPRLGGNPVMLLAGGFDPAISPGGDLLAVALEVERDDTRIAVVSLDDPSQIQVLTKPGDGVWDQRNPSWSPNGESICYNGFRNLWLVDLEGDAARRLTTDSSGNKEPEWSPDGRHIYFTSARQDTRALWRIRADGRSPQRITSGTGPESHPTISRDGLRLAYTTFVEDLDPVIVNLDTGTSTRVRSARADWGGQFLADGRGFLFISNRSGPSSVWFQPLDGSGPAASANRLNEQTGESSNIDLSPDDQWIVYEQRMGDNTSLFILPFPAGPPRIFSEALGVFIHPAWSPDGSKIAFLREHDGVSDLMIRSVVDGQPDGLPQHIHTGEHSLMWPQWSPVGNSIAYVAAEGDSRDLWIVNMDGRTGPRRVTAGAQILHIKWIPSTDRLLASAKWDGKEISIRHIDVETGEALALGRVISFGATSQYGLFDVSRDGNLVLITFEEVGGDLWLLEASKGTF